MAANALPLAGNLRVDFSDGAALAVNSRVPIPPGAHFYWRVYIEANNGDSYTSIGEVYMRDLARRRRSLRGRHRARKRP